MAQGAICTFEQWTIVRPSNSKHNTGLLSEAEADAVSNGNTNLNAAEGTWLDANSQIEKEEPDVERAISGIMEVQVFNILDC